MNIIDCRGLTCPEPVLQTRKAMTAGAVIEMERRGVEIRACDTCLEYFHLEKELRVGRITDMSDIVNTMATAARVMSPY
jgi:intracellular sulfur oxidation DsrE/DsrF family protein